MTNRHKKAKSFVRFLALLGLSVGSGTAQPGVTLKWDQSGLSSLSYGGVDYLGFGDFRLNQVIFQSADGQVFAGDLNGTTTVDSASHRLIRTFSWGSITAVYGAADNRMTARVTVDNRSGNTIKDIWFNPFGLRLPSAPREYDGVQPLLTDTIGQPALVRVSYAGAGLVLAAEDGVKPGKIGF